MRVEDLHKVGSSSNGPHLRPPQPSESLSIDDRRRVLRDMSDVMYCVYNQRHSYAFK